MFKDLYNSYNNFYVDQINTNRFQPEVFYSILESYKNINIKQEGSSIEGRPIYSISLGKGPVKVILWSQMHGNESTATRALLDLLNFNEAPKEFGDQWRNVLDKLTITIVPILNPDGTARFTRRNAIDIDLNRDAREFVSPEAQLLRRLLKEIDPDFGFNLHDQRRHYNIIDTAKPSSISFLAPGFNESEEVNETRERAMQLIALLRQELETVIPGQIGIYIDDFAPRAFGDYAQSLGISTLLVESGWQAYDIEKESIRKLNFCLILSGLRAISESGYLKFSTEDYKNIPINDEKMLDVLIRNALISKNSQQFKVDIGIERTELSLPPTGAFYCRGEVKDMGDLKEWHGFEEVDARELLVVPGRILELSYEAWHELTETEQAEYLKQGYIYLVEPNSSERSNFAAFINIISAKQDIQTEFKSEELANFLLLDREGEIQYVVINGFLCPKNEDIAEGVNGLIIS